MRIDKEFREPTSTERLLLDRLLEADFPGREDLVRMISNIRVRTIDESGSLELRTYVDGKASVTKQIPVEAEGKDEDGFTIHILLHVAEGRPTELEIYKDGESGVKELPHPSRLELIVLPPVPHGGWADRKG